MSKISLLMVFLLSVSAEASSTEWLLQSTAKPLDIELSGSRTITVCSADEGCKVIIVYD